MEPKSATSSHRGPDFIGIGLPISGTRWLYDQLDSHDETHMPVQKELHFLDRGMRLRSAQNHWRRLQKLNAGREQPDEANIKFLETYLNSAPSEDLKRIEALYYEKEAQETDRFAISPFVHLSAPHYDWYLSLFDPFKPKITGDVTPGYFAVDERKIAELKTFVPSARVILIVRHPVDHYISALKKRVRKGDATPEEVELQCSNKTRIENDIWFNISRSATRAYKNWSSVYGAENIKVVIFDDIVSDPEQVRLDLCHHIGISTDPGRFSLPASHNRKNRNAGDDQPLNLKPEILYRLLAREIEECQQLFGNSTLNWRYSPS